MTKMIRTTLAGLVAALLTGCASTPSTPSTRPAWVDQPAADRPAAVYLSAVGSGDTRPASEDAALARLAQRIEVQVQSVETAHLHATSGTDQPPSQTSELDRRVTLDADVVLLAAEVADTWRDARDGTWFSRAVMDRSAAGQVYRDAMRALLERATIERRAAEATEAVWPRFLRLGAARLSAERHDSLARVAGVVDPPGGVSIAPHVAAEHDALRRSIGVRVEPGPGATQALVDVTRDALLAAGLSTVPTAGDVIVRVRYEGVPRVFRQRNDCIVEWRATVAFVDPARDQSTDALTLEGSGWGLEPDQAVAAAERDARRRLDAGLPPFLDGLLYPVREADTASSDSPRKNP